MSISLSRAVTMITGTAERVRSALHTSVPLIPGSIRSSSTMSAPLRSNSASASWPVAATAVVKPSLRSRNASGSAKDSSSSTISTLVISILQLCRPRPDREQRSGRPSRRGRPGRSGGWRSAAGSRMVNVDPVPGLLHSRTSPPWLASTCLTIARPRPVPPVARERAGSTRKNRSNTRCWCSGAMPMPRSVTAISTQPSTARRDTETDASAGE